MTCHKSQEARILELLLRARGAWVPAPELATVSLQYNARVYSLRRLGLAIENRVVTSQDGTRRGFFRLRANDFPNPCHAEPDAPAPAAADVHPLPPLFAEVAELCADHGAECSRLELARQRRSCR